VRPLPPSVTEPLAARGRDLTLLVIRLGAMGDIVRTLPAVRALRAHLPQAALVWVCDARWEQLLRHHPDLDGTVPLPRRDWEAWSRSPRGWPVLARDLARWTSALRSLSPHIALDFQGNARSGVVGRLSGAPVRLGYAGHQQKEGNRLLTTHRVHPGPRRTSRMDRNLALVAALGVPPPARLDAGLPHSAAREAEAGALARHALGSDGPYAVLGPGASPRQAYKKPPPTLLAAAARAAAAAGVAPLVVFGPGEEDDAARVGALSGGTARLAPPTDLPLLQALLRGARLFVGGDSGPLHLACAVGCPVVGIYGPTDPAVNAPWGVPHQVVSPPGRVYRGVKRLDRESGGFAGIEPVQAAEAVSRLLG
jgi:heptosyltransferase-1